MAIQHFNDAHQTVSSDEDGVDVNRLDDILFRLETGSLRQKKALEEWLLNYAIEEGGAVMLRPLKLSDHSAASGFKVRLDGKEISFPPRGRRVEKRMAVRLLQRHGLRGRYTGRDQASGLSQDQIDSWPEELLRTIRAYREDKLSVNEIYLSHITEEMLAQEEHEREAKRAAKEQEAQLAAD